MKREELIGREVTLNGEPAVISGRHLRFAMVRQIRTGLGAEWSWTAAARIVEEGGQFRT